MHNVIILHMMCHAEEINVLKKISQESNIVKKMVFTANNEFDTLKSKFDTVGIGHICTQPLCATELL